LERRNKIYLRIIISCIILNVFFIQFITGSETVQIDMSQNWSLIPPNEPVQNIDLPCFYVWNEMADKIGESVDGKWKVIPGIPEIDYKKVFNIPNSMIGKRVFLYFIAVNYVADFYVNNQLIGSHYGGYVPIQFDITPYVNIPSTNNKLRVKIKYWDDKFIYFNNIGDENVIPLWPIGWHGHYYNMGIIGNVKLIGRSSVYIEDVFIKPSVREESISLEITIVNADNINHRVQLTANIIESGISFGSHNVDVSAGDTVSVNLSQDWSNPNLWEPGNPVLYYCIAQLYESNNLINEKGTRFGFREFWTESDPIPHFVLNGIRQNLRGDNIVIRGEKRYWKYLVPNYNNWSSIVDSLLALNFNVIRLHQEPVPPWMLNICDEKGLMVIAESAIYGEMPSVGLYPELSNEFTNNSAKWIKEWIKYNRNHPSIIIWSAENERRHQHLLRVSQVLQFGDAITSMDNTRPIVYEGDKTLQGSEKVEICSYHYILKYSYPNTLYYNSNGWPPGSIYEILTPFVNASLPTSWGEFDWYKKTNPVPYSGWAKLQAIKTRAARYINVADVRPYRLDWAWHPNPDFFEIYENWKPSKNEVELLRNSMNPVAVFDKAYYEFSIDPEITKFNEGNLINRTLIVFNDERANTQVEVRWKIIVQGQVVNSESFVENIPLGFYTEKNISFVSPYVEDTQNFILQLSSWKNGKERFREELTFSTIDVGISIPQGVSDLTIQRSGNKLNLSWSPVEKDKNNNPVEIEHYIIYRSTEYPPEGTETNLIGVTTEHVFTDNTAGIIGNPEQNYYYCINAVDKNGAYSDKSNIVGEFDFNIATTYKTDFNAIALPLNMQGLIDAESLSEAIPGCNSIGRWNSGFQGFQQYNVHIPPTNFSVELGNPFYAHATINTVFTLFGDIVQSNFALINNKNTSSFNEIMVPLDKSNIKKAKELCEDIPYCNSIAQWNVSTQGFDQFYINLPGVNNFDIRAGYPYQVNVTENVNWPGTGIEKNLNVKLENNDHQEGSSAPHMVWGKMIVRNDLLSIDKINFRTYITNRPEEILTKESPGCLIQDSIWVIQCSSFPSNWKSGDVLKVIFTNNSEYLSETEVELTYEAADKADDILFEEEISLPMQYDLAQNYPNPLNPETIINYTIPTTDRIKIIVYNMTGQNVRNLVDEKLNPGFYKVKWNGLDNYGIQVPSGMYVVRMVCTDVIKSRKMLLIR
jgi:hypothetical protein